MAVIQKGSTQQNHVPFMFGSHDILCFIDFSIFATAAQ